MKLNKTERDALIRKIKEHILERAREENQKKIDSYVPSNDYLKASDYFDLIIKVIPELVKLLNKSTGQKVDTNRFVDWIGAKEIWLGRIRDKELEIKIPSVSYGIRDKIDDDLILQGIDSDSSVESMIQNLTDKYYKLI